jgi:metal-responsive CopG/Arc/MetJ family transcriptional regulator
MKTAISLPDDLYAEAEAYADCHGLSRSGLYAAALRDYLDRHNDDAITSAIDTLLQAHPELAEQEPDLASAAHQALQRIEW